MVRQRRVALATSARYPDLPGEERLVIPALAECGAVGEPVVWDADDAAWATFDAVVIRSCWDYHLKLDAFLAWLERVARLGVPVLNSPRLIRWNSDKRYLVELAGRGVTIVPTQVIQRGTEDPAAALLQALDRLTTEEAVVKPAVSASAHGTWRTSRARAAADASAFKALVAAGDVLVQPFVPVVGQAGEWSVVCLGGTPSHTVLKRPAPGDWRVQGELGGTAQRLAMPEGALQEAQQVLTAAEARGATYARVDGCVIGGRFVLMELELIEPQLYLSLEPDAAARFARAIVEALD